MDYRYLSLAVGETGAGGHRRADSAARTAVPGWVIGALRPVADGNSSLRAVTHPLGFTCLPIERAGREGVCVHLWSPRVERAEPTTSTIHAHCWHLTSYTLFGHLENMLMHVADADFGDAGGSGGAGPGFGFGGPGGSGGPGPGGPGPGGVAGPGPGDLGLAGADPGLYRMLEVRSHGDVDELRPTPRLVRCVPRQRQAVSAGDVYSMPAGEFHTTEVSPATETATVALGRMTPGAADCSLGALASTGHLVRRRRCDAAQTAAAARIVLDRLLAPTTCPSR